MTTLLIQTETVPLKIHLASPAQMTTEEFVAFCLANSELQIERTANGDVIVMPPAFSDAGNRNSRIAVQLGIWMKQDGTGEGFGPSTGFTLPNGAIRSPDVSWIKSDRWNALTNEQKASFAPICPDFVVELRSSSDSLKNLQDKMQEYLDNGASLGFLIDRPTRSVHVYRLGREPEILNDPEVVTGDPELPKFVLQMARIW